MQNQHLRSDIEVQEQEIGNDDEMLPDIVIENEEMEENEPVVDLTNHPEFPEDGVVIDLTVPHTDQAIEVEDVPSNPLDLGDVIITDNVVDCTAVTDKCSLATNDEYIPDRIYWESILGALEHCKTDSEFESKAIEISKTLKPLRPRNLHVHFQCGVDVIDPIAERSIPQDSPKNLCPIQIASDGNCLCRSISHSYSGEDTMHLELRARIILDGILRKKYYMSNECLSRGTTNYLNDEPLPHLYVRYSDHYVNGQKITDSTVEYIYSRELHDCTKVNSYMGLWQLAQASSVLNVPIQSVYPEGTDPIMRLDFN